MFRRLTSFLRRKPLNYSKLWKSDDLEGKAFFFDPAISKFIYKDYMGHGEMLEAMGLGGGYSKGLDRIFKRGLVRGFFHTPDAEWQEPEYIFLQATDKASLVALADAIVTKRPFIMVNWDISKAGDSSRMEESGSQSVRELSSLKPSHVAIARQRAALENWPDPERDY